MVLVEIECNFLGMLRVFLKEFALLPYYYSEGRCNILGAEVSKVILTDFILFSRACFQPVFCKCMFLERPSCEVKIKHLGPPGPAARTRGEPNTLGVAVAHISRYQIAHLLEN